MEALTASGMAKLTGIAPQFLVDNLQRSIEYTASTWVSGSTSSTRPSTQASVGMDVRFISRPRRRPMPTGLTASNTSISTRTLMFATQLPCMTNCGHAGRLSRSPWKRGRGRAGTSMSKIRTATFCALASGRSDMPLHLTARGPARACPARSVPSLTRAVLQVSDRTSGGIPRNSTVTIEEKHDDGRHA